MLKKYLSNKTINLLEYYSTLNINNIFSNNITKSKHGSFANKEMLVSQLFKEINDQLNTKNNNNFFYKGNPDSQIMILGDFPNDDDVKNQEILSGSRGELLNKMLSSISLEKEKYYLSNIYFEKDIDIRNRNNFYKDILINQNTPWAIVSGLGDQRTQNAIKIIDKNLYDIGGKALFSFSAEFRKQINFPFKGLGFATFLDGGQIWRGINDIDIMRSFGFSTDVIEGTEHSGVQYGVGGGLSYDTPIGPIRIDLAYKLNPTQADLAIFEGRSYAGPIKRWAIHFSIGHPF